MGDVRPAEGTGQDPVTKPADKPFSIDYSDPANIDKLPEDVKSYVRKVKDQQASAFEEAAARRKELRETQAQLSKLEKERNESQAAELAEKGRYKELYEKEQAEKLKLVTESGSRLKRAEIRAIAIQEGILDQEVANLIALDKVTVDEYGNITGVEEVVREFKTRKPHLFKNAAAPEPVVKPTGSASVEPPAAEKPTMGDVSTMKKDDYEQKKREVMAKLRNSR